MKILVAEDDSNLAQGYKDALESRHHEVILTANGDECLEKYANEAKDKRRQSSLTTDQKEKELPKNRESHKSGLNLPFDVVILDYKMPKKDGLQVAKEILDLNPDQRIIFASGYVKDTLIDSVKYLKRVVELIQKPFGLQQLIDTVEDQEAFEALNKLIVNIRSIRDPDASKEEVKRLFENLRRIQKYRTY